MTRMLETNEVQISREWTFEKRLSLDNMLILLVNIVAVVWLFAKADGRIERLEGWLPMLQSIQESRPQSMYRLQMLEQNQVQVGAVIERITKLEIETKNLQELVSVQSSVINRIDMRLADQQDEGKKNGK